MKLYQIRSSQLLIISVIIVLLVTLIPGNGKIAGVYVDKVVHVLIFFFLSMNIGFRFQNSKKLRIALSCAVFLALITEVFQLFIPGRNLELFDMIANCIGIFCGIYIYGKYMTSIDNIMLKIGMLNNNSL